MAKTRDIKLQGFFSSKPSCNYNGVEYSREKKPLGFGRFGTVYLLTDINGQGQKFVLKNFTITQKYGHWVTDEEIKADLRKQLKEGEKEGGLLKKEIEDEAFLLLLQLILELSLSIRTTMSPVQKFLR